MTAGGPWRRGRLGLEDGAAVGVDAASQAGDGGGVSRAEAGADEEGSAHAQPHQGTDDGDEGSGDGDEDRGAEDDAAQASAHAVEGDRQRLPVQQDRQEDRQNHRAGQVHLLPNREKGDPHARSDQKHRGNEAKSVGDHVGDNRGGNDRDAHVDGHEAAELPSCAECGGLTAAGSGGTWPDRGRFEPGTDYRCPL